MSKNGLYPSNPILFNKITPQTTSLCLFFFINPWSILIAPSVWDGWAQRRTAEGGGGSVFFFFPWSFLGLEQAPGAGAPSPGRREGEAAASGRPWAPVGLRLAWPLRNGMGKRGGKGGLHPKISALGAVPHPVWGRAG